MYTLLTHAHHDVRVSPVAQPSEGFAWKAGPHENSHSTPWTSASPLVPGLRSSFSWFSHLQWSQWGHIPGLGGFTVI